MLQKYEVFFMQFYESFTVISTDLPIFIHIYANILMKYTKTIDENIIKQHSGFIRIKMISRTIAFSFAKKQEELLSETF